MRKIAGLLNLEVTWKQPSALQMRYELLAGEELAATLNFRSAFGSLATGESADGCWTFKRAGFFQTRVTIRVCGEHKDIGIFRNNTWSGGGTLELPDGRKMPATTNLWKTQLEFKTESGDTMLRFRRAGLIHLSALVEIQQETIGIAELPWIVMLGWYLIVMMQMDSAVVAV